MGKWIGFLVSRLRGAIAVLLIAHGVLAACAPCPYRAENTREPSAAPHAAHGRSGHQASAEIPETCPYDLMHALFGVFKPAPRVVGRPTLSQPIVVSVAPVALQTRIDRSDPLVPPPRFT